MNEVAIPRCLVGYKFTATDIAITEQMEQLRNRMKLITIEQNSVRMLSEKHDNAEISIQTPEIHNMSLNRLFPNNLPRIKSNGQIVLHRTNFGEIFLIEKLATADITKLKTVIPSAIWCTSIFLLSTFWHLKTKSSFNLNRKKTFISHTYLRNRQHCYLAELLHKVFSADRCGFEVEVRNRRTFQGISTLS